MYMPNRCTLDFEEATAEAERGRKRGSAWSIREVPACAFVGEDETLVVADATAQLTQPMMEHQYTAACRPYMSAIANYLSCRGSSRIRLVAARTDLPKVKEFFNWASTNYGPSYPLFWRRLEASATYDLSRVRAILNVYRRSRARCAFWGLIHSPQDAGVSIERLHRQSPLAKSGVIPGDVVCAVQNITKGNIVTPLAEAIARGRPGDTLIVALRRADLPRVTFSLQAFRDAVRSSQSTVAKGTTGSSRLRNGLEEERDGGRS